MAKAEIEVNSSVGSETDLPIDTQVQLSNNDDGDEQTYEWSIVDQPPGTADNLSSTTIENPTFTPQKEGTYLLKLIVDKGLATEDSDTVVAAVRQLKTDERIPAAGETNEAGSRGWADAAGPIIREHDNKLTRAPEIVAEAGSTVPGTGKVVRFTDSSTIKGSLPGEETVPIVETAPASSIGNVDGVLGVVIGAVGGGSISQGTLLRVRLSGLYTGVSLSGVNDGDPVFVDDSADLSLSEGTVRRKIAKVVAVPSADTGDLYLDGAAFDFDGLFAGTNPQAIEPDDSAATGSAQEAARIDHQHAIVAAAPGTIEPDDAAAEGAATSFARSDHQHAIAAAAAGTVAVGDSAAEGAATSFARSDHTHALPSPANGTIADVDKSAAAAGASSEVAPADHKHDVSTAAAGTTAVGDAAAEGSATSLARSDHQHALPAPTDGTIADVDRSAAAAGTSSRVAPADHKHDISTAAAGTIEPDDAAAEGAASSLARSDHQHAITTAAPATIGSANAEGAATSFARSDHVHDHGNQGGGSLHANATQATAGFQSSADKTKQDAFELSQATVQTTDGTTTKVAQQPIADGESAILIAHVTAVQSDKSAAAGYRLIATFRNDSGTINQVGSTDKIAQEDTAAWDAAFATATNAVDLEVTGDANTINWSIVLEARVAP